MSLLREIQSAAIDSSVNLPNLLRKCKILAVRLGSEDFKQWIDYELSGYPNKESLPEYRVLNVNSKGHFSGLFGSALNNADIPLLCMPEKLRDMLGHSYLMQPVAAIESLLENKDLTSFQEQWNPDLVARVGQKIYQNMNCMQAWKVIPAGAIVAAIDVIRTRILNFVLEIEAQNPSAGEAELNSIPVPMEKVSQIFNTFITGNVQNLAHGSSNALQTAEYVDNRDTGVLENLLEAIKSANIQPHASKPLEDVVVKMQETQGTSSFGQHYKTFMSILADHMQVLGPVVAPYLPASASMLT